MISLRSEIRGAEQRLIIFEERLVDNIDIVAGLLQIVFDNNIRFAGVCEGEAGFFQECLNLGEGEP